MNKKPAVEIWMSASEKSKIGRLNIKLFLWLVIAFLMNFLHLKA